MLGEELCIVGNQEVCFTSSDKTAASTLVCVQMKRTEHWAAWASHQIDTKRLRLFFSFHKNRTEQKREEKIRQEKNRTEQTRQEKKRQENKRKETPALFWQK